MKFKRSLLLLSTLFVGQIFSAEYTLDANFVDHIDGIYEKGEDIVLKAQILEDGKPMTGKTLRYVVKKEGMGGEIVDVPSDKSVTIKTKMDKPGRCTFTFIAMDGKNMMQGKVEGKDNRGAAFDVGVIVSPLEVKPAVEAPADFKEFWDKEKKILEDMPLNAKVVPAPEAPAHDKITFVTCDVGQGFRPVNGIVHIPANAEPKSLPIQLFVHGAGVDQPKIVWTPPARGAARRLGKRIIMNLPAHGLPCDKPKEFYDELNKGELKLYPFINNGDVNKYYMKGMILRVIRALQYLKSLPEWNGKDIVVNGGSQGGAQSLFAAGADPQVTEIFAEVPAMCDLGGTVVGRVAGWPKPYYKQGDKYVLSTDYGSHNVKPADKSVEKFAGYFDAVNFAKYINPECKVYMLAGGIDGVCPSTSIFAAYNTMPAKVKVIDFSPRGNHCRGIYNDLDNLKIARFENEKKLPAGSGSTPLR